MAHAHPDPLKLTHQCEVLGQMLIEKRDCGNDMQTLACLKLILEQLKKTMAPLGFDVPDYNGAIDAEQALKATLNRLREKLNNPSEFESPWKLCCEALELVKELLYQQERGLSAGQVVGGYDLGVPQLIPCSLVGYLP